jgi:hypothetical protein
MVATTALSIFTFPSHVLMNTDIRIGSSRIMNGQSSPSPWFLRNWYFLLLTPWWIISRACHSEWRPLTSPGRPLVLAACLSLNGRTRFALGKGSSILPFRPHTVKSNFLQLRPSFGAVCRLRGQAQLLENICLQTFAVCTFGCRV